MHNVSPDIRKLVALVVLARRKDLGKVLEHDILADISDRGSQ